MHRTTDGAFLSLGLLGATKVDLPAPPRQPRGEKEAEKDSKADRAWFEEQVKCYTAMEPRYRLYAETLQRVLEAAAKKYAPLAIVQTRSKSLTSFPGMTGSNGCCSSPARVPGSRGVTRYCSK